MLTPARLRPIRAGLALGGTLAALIALSACETQEAEPAQTAALADGTLPPLPEALPMTAAAAPVAYAPAADRLPTAPRLAYADPGGADYAWIDRADTIFDVIGDAPPDYGFAYDDVEPWGWETAGGYVTYAEPIEDGRYRYYYFEPESDYPYLVRDATYSYAYSTGRIAAVYDAGGALLPLAYAIRRADYGSRYYARAHELRRAARRHRRGVAAPVWAARRPVIARARERWAHARETQPAWREWRQRETARAQRRQLREERETRRIAARRFARWQRQGLQGATPALYTSQPRQAERVQRQARRAQLQAERARRQAQRARAIAGSRQDEIAAAQRRRREIMRPELEPPRGAARGQLRAERQAERAAQRQMRTAARAGQAQAQAREQRRAMRQAQRSQMRIQRQQQATERQRRVAERQRQTTERQRRQGELRQRAERQRRETAQLARQQQAERRRAQMASAQRAQRTQREAAQRQQREAQRARMQAAREQQRAARTQAVAARQRQQAASRQRAAEGRARQAAAQQQRAAARQQEVQRRQQARQAATQARAERRAQRGGERRMRRD